MGNRAKRVIGSAALVLAASDWCPRLHPRAQTCPTPDIFFR